MNTILRSLSALLLLVWLASSALAQPPVAANELATAEKPGVTLYQVSGLKGSIPLKKVYKVDPSGDTGHYELEFASSKLNTDLEIMAKFVVPSDMTFVSFELRTANGPKQVTTAGADSWDGKTLIDKVTVSPWNMNRVLQQCIAQLDNGDGTFKSSATFDLEADATEVIRGKGIAKFPNAPPGSASSLEGTMRPRTRVTAYIASEERRGGVREASRVTMPRVVLPPREVERPVVNQTTNPAVSPPPQRQPVAPVRLTGTVNPMPAKERFERTKPHVNARSSPPKQRQPLR